jgi:hypothetical protein
MKTIKALVLPLLLIGTCLSLAEALQPNQRETIYRRYLDFPSIVRGGAIKPHWMADGSSFWYAEGAPANTILYKVDPRENTKSPLLDPARVRRVLTAVLGHDPPYQGVPFDEFSFVDSTEKAIKFTVENRQFVLDFDTYELIPAHPLHEVEQTRHPSCCCTAAS